MMDDSSAEPETSWQSVLICMAITVEAILTVGILFMAPETIKTYCFTAVGILATITTLIPVFKKKRGAFFYCIAMILVALGAVLLYTFCFPPDEPEPPSASEQESSPAGEQETAASSALPPEQAPASNDSYSIAEIDPTKDSMDLLTFEKVEENLSASKSNYFPNLEMQDCRHLFLSFTEEFSDPDRVDIREYQSYILKHAGDWDIEKLKKFIEQQFQEFYQSVEDYPSQLANTNATIAKNNKRLDELADEISQALATNEPVLPLYEEYAGLYREIIGIAPRGEYYVQLARPYEEGILHMRRTEASEKNAVFLWAANAVAYFRIALTYQDPVGASVSDIFYRIAKVYHYIGDTPGLHLEIRSYFYRVSEAYLTLAAEREAKEDTYYGYSTYYGAMVYHKLAIITTVPEAKQDYLELAEQNYKKADKDYILDSSAKNEITHALADIATRKRQMR